MLQAPTPLHPLSVTYRATASLKPDPRNARTHSKRQVEQIIASIRQFGFTNPILVDPDGELIAGHGRLLAAKAIGMAEVPTIQLAGLSEAQKRALRLADNKIALNAGWDLDLLRIELGELAAIDVDLDLTVTGFSTGELDLLLSGNEDPDDDLIPPLPEEPRTEPGDIWRLGDHVIGCGDSRDLGFLQKVVGEGGAIDAAFLDPPYNVRISGHANTRGRHREFAMASGEMTEEEFRAFLRQTLEPAAQVSATAPSTSSAWIGATWTMSPRSVEASMASSSTSASGTRAMQGWARSIARSTSWSSSIGWAARRISMRSSLGGMAVTAPTSGTTA